MEKPNHFLFQSNYLKEFHRSGTDGQDALKSVNIKEKMEKESKERRIFQKLKFNIHRLNAEFPKKEFNIMTDRDTVISDLEALERQARQHNFLELEELASIAIGKRIFNLEKNKKKLESMKKKEKKKEIQEKIRLYKIRKIDYEELSKEKLKEGSFIIASHRNGRWFIPQNTYEGEDKQIFEKSEYKMVIREVNKILFEKYYDLGVKLEQVDVFWRILIVLFCSMMVLYLSVPFFYFQTQYLLAYAIYGVLFVVLMAYVVKVFSCQYELNSARRELQNLFKEFSNRGYIWSCPEEDKLLYLQMKIQNQSHPK